jgi:hypothetical protein
MITYDGFHLNLGLAFGLTTFLSDFVNQIVCSSFYTSIHEKSFFGVQYRSVAINGWVLATSQPITYRVKWNYGRPRPEEIAWLITTGNLTPPDGVPADLVATVLRVT